MHRKYPFVGGLALGLVLLSAVASAAEYSGATVPGLPWLDVFGNSAPSGNVKAVENGVAPSGDAAAAEEARKLLKDELDRMRRGTRHEKAESKPGSQQPAKKKEPTPGVADAPHPQPPKAPAPAVDPEINRAAGKLMIMRFSGSEPSDTGPKAIRALIHDGLIAGVMFGSDNIQSKIQLKELVKSLGQGGGEPKPLLRSAKSAALAEHFLISRISKPGLPSMRWRPRAIPNMPT